MKSAYDLTREFIEVMADIDELLSKRAKACDIRERDLYDEEINRKECRMFEIKHLLLAIKVD